MEISRAIKVLQDLQSMVGPDAVLIYKTGFGTYHEATLCVVEVVDNGLFLYRDADNDTEDDQVIKAVASI